MHLAGTGLLTNICGIWWQWPGLHTAFCACCAEAYEGTAPGIYYYLCQTTEGAVYKGWFEVIR
ncbi:MAG: hypothetical protein JWR44_2552 [Hymenobacter sp.]|jgi:hypothetical protein|nr:hypothetical protein [Hymenobacter sp.]